SQGTYDSLTGLWNVGLVTTAAPRTLVIEATAASPDPQTNTASVSHSDALDPDAANNSTAVTATPQQADLQITKTVDNPTPHAGDTATYTVTLTNNGPDTATNVTVLDVLPPQVTFQSFGGPAGTSYDPATGIWTVGTVVVGTPQVLILTSLVTSPNPQSNTATATHADQFDPNTANNSDTASVDPQQANLAVNKTVSNTRPNVGDIITFTVTLADNGPNSATGVQVTDVLPAGVTLVAAAPSRGTYAPAT